MQPFDLTTAIAVHRDLARRCLPARVEVVQQTDLWTLHLALRTLEGRQWVTLSWHPQAARFHLGQRIPKGIADPFQFSQILQRLRGFALCQILQLDPWERVTDWQFALRPQEEAQWHLYLETMGKYSNVALVDRDGIVVACGRGVSDRQSSVRPLQAGLAYQPPPPLTGAIPNPDEPLEDWQDRLVWPAGPLRKTLLQAYRGLSRAIVEPMAAKADLSPQVSTEAIAPEQWQLLFDCWQEWLAILKDGGFQPGWSERGYTVTGWNSVEPVEDIHKLLDDYYRRELENQQFDRDRHRLRQKLHSVLRKLEQRRQDFARALEGSERAGEAKRAADLLMAHLQDWQPGLTEIALSDFETGESVAIQLDPEKNAIANAQQYYKKHRKQKRARTAVTPLLEQVNREIAYLEQVLGAIEQLDGYRTSGDLQALCEIERELISEGYLGDRDRPSASIPSPDSDPHRYTSPSGFEILVGRNNRQNDLISFKLARNTDWWLHAQEIPGSHVLLRLPPGAVAEDEDLQAAADLAAYYSRARLSARVPTIYTRPKHVYKLKGADAKPGMVTYLQQQVLWAQPQRAEAFFSIRQNVENEG
ncbi:NFACT family protein [Synechococcus sp. PCC 7336]|uniref:Rqc2 family fibronectin-binding protein n=1 Tax=Synechococcus sp. PCC 7336 TaxID=195250 RepID=UPI0003450ADA|nr:NFACT RNA binding domain-containing protein [Synechococcus sp. PCC 7336]